MSVRRANPGFKVINQDGSLTLIIRQAHPWLTAYFGGVFIMMAWLIIASLSGNDDRIGPQLPASFVYFNALACAFITFALLNDKVRVEVTRTEFVRTRSFFGLSWKTRFALKDIRGFHIYGPIRNPRHKTSFQLLFYYGGSVATLAKGLTQAKAKLILGTLLRLN